MCVKESRKVTNGKRVAKGQDVFNIIRGPICLERRVYREPMGDQVRSGSYDPKFSIKEPQVSQSQYSRCAGYPCDIGLKAMLGLRER